MDGIQGNPNYRNFGTLPAPLKGITGASHKGSMKGEADSIDLI